MKDLTMELETGGWSTVTSLGRLWYKGNESGDTLSNSYSATLSQNPG
jgi:phosphoribosyl-AMP cyclohydrolase